MLHRNVLCVDLTLQLVTRRRIFEYGMRKQLFRVLFFFYSYQRRFTNSDEDTDEGTSTDIAEKQEVGLWYSYNVNNPLSQLYLELDLD